MGRGGWPYRAYWAIARRAIRYYPPPENAPRTPQTAEEFYKILIDPERVPLHHWQYKGTKEWHVGPTAQEWWKATGLGRNNITIFPTDVAFALLAALRHSEKERRQLSRRVEKLEKQLTQAKK